MEGTQSSAILAMKILREKEIVAKVRITLKLFVGAE
jgi:hypothetical protein